MTFKNPGAELFVPDAVADTQALARTTHLGIAAHQDDLEILAYEPIIACFGQTDKWFTGVVVTNGSGSPRDSIYADYSDEQMREVRKREQKKAAYVGEYAAQALLDYPSSGVKDSKSPHVVDDLKAILLATRPDVVYTHNLADKHDTHVGVALRTITAIRQLPADQRPKRLLGVEVWRDLDWLCDDDKVCLRTDSHENIAAALVGVFDSQICGGKRYDLATMGRRRAHATYFASHGVDECDGMTFAMDLTALLQDDALDPAAHALSYIDSFRQEVAARVAKFS